MKDKSTYFINDLIERHSELEYLRKPITDAVKAICGMKEYNKILLCGNGGSAADSEHMAGELNKGFILKRKIDNKLVAKLNKQFPEDAEMFEKHLQNGIQSIPLGSLTGTNTAYLNDCEPSLLFAQGVNVFGKSGDILVCFSTSGNSKNVVNAAKLAKLKGLTIISLTGESGGKLKDLSDILLNAPSSVTHLIQEYHLPIYHTICLAVENEIFGE